MSLGVPLCPSVCPSDDPRDSFFELAGENGHHGRVSVHGGEGKAGDVRLRRGGQLRVDVHPLLDTGVHVSLYLLARARATTARRIVFPRVAVCGKCVRGCGCMCLV